MSFNWFNGIVRIFAPNGNTTGTGFVVSSDGLVVTCAHVIEKMGVDPEHRVGISFSHGDQDVTAIVLSEWWNPERDVAFLKLDHPIHDLEPLALGASRGCDNHTVRTFGHPKIKTVGLHGKGIVDGIIQFNDGRTLIQIDSRQITSGFSGAPLWDEKTGAVIGMVTSIARPDYYGRLGEVAFATRTEDLVAVCPKLHYNTSLYVPDLPQVETPGEELEIKPGKQLQLGLVNYLIREIFVEQITGEFGIRTIRASDLSMNRDVGIQQITILSPEPKPATLVRLNHVVQLAKNRGQLARRCHHLPDVLKVIHNQNAAWIIVEWVKGKSLEKSLPLGSPLPAPPALRKIIGWLLQVSEALSILHQKRLSHGDVNARNILIASGKREAVLIYPGFVGSSKISVVDPIPFDAVSDIRDLAATLFEIITQKQTTSLPASTFNPSVPEILDELIQGGVSGKIISAKIFKHKLLDAQRALRSL
jgi:hypothetical protein